MPQTRRQLQPVALDTVNALLIHDLDASVLSPESLKIHQKALFESGLKALNELNASGEVLAFGMGINTLTLSAARPQFTNLIFYWWRCHTGCSTREVP